jgi:hypothetical protein
VLLCSWPPTSPAPENEEARRHDREQRDHLCVAGVERSRTSPTASASSLSAWSSAGNPGDLRVGARTTAAVARVHRPDISRRSQRTPVDRIEDFDGNVRFRSCRARQEARSEGCRQAFKLAGTPVRVVTRCAIVLRPVGCFGGRPAQWGVVLTAGGLALNQEVEVRILAPQLTMACSSVAERRPVTRHVEGSNPSGPAYRGVAQR